MAPVKNTQQRSMSCEYSDTSTWGCTGPCSPIALPAGARPRLIWRSVPARRWRSTWASSRARRRPRARTTAPPSGAWASPRPPTSPSPTPCACAPRAGWPPPGAAALCARVCTTFSCAPAVARAEDPWRGTRLPASTALLHLSAARLASAACLEHGRARAARAVRLRAGGGERRGGALRAGRWRLHGGAGAWRRRRRGGGRRRRAAAGRGCAAGPGRRGRPARRRC